MTLTINSATSANVLAPLVTAFDSGTNNALVVIYAGTAPTNADAALSGNTVLAKVVLSKPSATVSNKVLTVSGTPKTEASADSTGSANFFRIFNSNDGVTPGTAVVQGSCGVSASDMILPTLSIAAGVSFSITSLTIQLP